ncbi:MAG: hypothetical protein HKP36_09785 [Myxococcales bacterium]|nr:hypothetical protein [Deltaproteobacteria bacterium]NNL24728.1 hypothetical protein [Myxococcales bacterium]
MPLRACETRRRTQSAAVPPTLSPQVLQAHDEAELRGDPGYLDPETGLFVLTATALRRQGACCGSGCRHCPYSAEEQRAAGRPTIGRSG